MAAPNTYNFTSGPSSLPDVGVLSYNNCTFSPLFETKVSGKQVKDEANRTVKFIEYTITADGFVTLPNGSDNISGNMATLYNLLSAQGGTLTYTGRGLDIVTRGDLAWGPVPEMLEFQPLGAGRSAKVQWRVITRLPPPSLAQGGGGLNAAIGDVKKTLGILQMNYDTSISYDEAGFSTISIKGVIESEDNRITVKNRDVFVTVDRFRYLLEERILKGIDLGRFHITRRTFNISRDKRTMEWDVEAQEKPYMDLPPYCTLAHGSYSVRPTKSGAGLANWNCSLKATYTLAGGVRRDAAYMAFFTLMNLRMQRTLIDAPFGENPPPVVKAVFNKVSERPLLIDFSYDEGLYLDSRNITFGATWTLICPFSKIMLASGAWRKVPEGSRNQNKNLWAQSMLFSPQGNIMGSKSWLENRLDPKLDVIIDFGSTEV